MSTSARSEQGFTLLEAAVTLALMGVLVVAGLDAVSGGARVASEAAVADGMRREAVQALQRIEQVVRASERGS